jgi:hypothetical protein
LHHKNSTKISIKDKKQCEMPTGNADAIYCSMLLALPLTSSLSIISKCQRYRHPPSKVPNPNPFIQFKPTQGNLNQPIPSHPVPNATQSEPIQCHSQNNKTPKIPPSPNPPNPPNLPTSQPPNLKPKPAPNPPAPPQPSSPKPHTTTHAPPDPPPPPSQSPPQSFQSAPRTPASPASRAPRSPSS